VKPIPLPPNQPPQFYRGGARIAAFRGLAAGGDRSPEDWLASTTARFGGGDHGLTVLPDGRLLRDAIAADPAEFLGPEHVARFGADPALLVKLLDAGERLPVHAHPDRTFAREHLGSAYGKSEAWLVLAADGGARVHVGFRADVGRDTLAGWAEHEDADAMLAAMHELPVAAGDWIYVPAGTPHAIGEGILILEVQEPSDLGVLLEWSRYALAREQACMGLDPDVALGCVRRSGVGEDELAAWCGDELAPDSRGFFRAEWLRGEERPPVERGYAVLVATSGSGRLDTEGGAVDLERGSTVLVPHAAGDGELSGAVTVVRCSPPVDPGVPGGG